MTDEEYAYLMNDFDYSDNETFYEVGLECYENGWVDVFGFVTPKGKKALREYKNESK